MESGEGDSVKYFTWPLTLSGPALREAVALFEMGADCDGIPHVMVELQNAANEARAMLQQIAVGDRRPGTMIDGDGRKWVSSTDDPGTFVLEPQEDIDPLLR